MNFRLTKGNFLKTGAYIDGDSAIFTFAAEKEDECSIVLLDKSGNTACVIDIPAEYSTGSLYSVRLHGFAVMSMHIILELMEKVHRSLCHKNFRQRKME